MTTTTVQSRSNNRSLWVAAAIGGVVAAILNAIIFFIGDGSGVTFTVPVGGPGSENTMELGILPIAFLSILPAFLAAGLILLLRRFTKHPMTIFYVLAVLVLIGSFLPLAQEGVAEDAIPYLAIMHVLAAGAIVGMLAYFGRTPSTE